jgi:hypothetical protein
MVNEMALEMLELLFPANHLSIFAPYLSTTAPAAYDNSDQSAYYENLCLYLWGFICDPSLVWFQSKYVNFIPPPQSKFLTKNIREIEYDTLHILHI